MDSTIIHSRIASDGTAQFGNVQRVLLRNTVVASLRNTWYEAELQALYVYDVLSTIIF